MNRTLNAPQNFQSWPRGAIRMAILLIIAMTFAANASTDQDSIINLKFENISRTEYKNSIGFTNGYSLGYGISYRRWINSVNAVQLTIGPIRVTNETGDYLPAGNLAGSILMKFLDLPPPLSLICYGSADFAMVSYRSKIETNFLIGGGGGFEFKIWHVSSLLTIGVAFGAGRVQTSTDYGIYYRF